MSYVKHFVTDDSPKGKVLRWLLVSIAITYLVEKPCARWGRRRLESAGNGKGAVSKRVLDT